MSMHKQWIATCLLQCKALQKLPRRSNSAIVSAAAAAQLRSSRCRAAPAHCTSCPAPRVLRARHKCRQSRALCGMPGAERACNRLADKPCARAGSTEIMGRPRRRRSESTRRARERAAKVCGRVSCCVGWIAGSPFPFDVEIALLELMNCGRRPKHVCTTVTISTPREG